jgi:hypothetical protein
MIKENGWNESWNELCYNIKENKCVPFVGPGASAQWIPPAREISEKLAQQYDYPSHDTSDLGKVSEFMAISSGDQEFPKKVVGRAIKEISLPSFASSEYLNTTHSVLADLDLPVYITLDYDNLMEQALKSKGKNPVSEVCIWNEELKRYVERASVFDKTSYEFTDDRPLVYHLMGNIDIPRSMVLTETDFLNFLLNLNREAIGILPFIHDMLVTASPLFIGFNPFHVFRFIIRALDNDLPGGFRMPAVITTIPPPVVESKRDKMFSYLQQYIQNVLHLQVYWGTSDMFAKELRARFEAYSDDKPTMPRKIRTYNKTAMPRKISEQFTDFTKIGQAADFLSLLNMYYQKSHAIIIGISKYKEETTLPNAYNDALSMKETLEGKCGLTTLANLFDQFATGDNIRQIFTDTLSDETKIGSKDRVLIYYSGHGKLRIRRGYGGQEIREGFIVPYDSKKEEYYKNIPMKTLVEACQQCPAKHVLLILDCCYSGAAFTRGGSEPTRPERVSDIYVKDITSRRAIQLLAAGQEDEPVSDSGIRPGYSAFTGALLDILEPETDLDNNGILSASELGTYIEQKVALQTPSGGRYQRPVYNRIAGSDNGDFVFKIFNM